MVSHLSGADVELVVDAHAELGEGPVWDSVRGILYWLDVLAGHLHVFDPRTGLDRVLEFGEPIGSVAPRTSGDLLLATPRGFVVADPDNGVRTTVLAPVEADNPDTRMNDGGVDPAGRFWAGTMIDGTAGAGTLYRLEPDGDVRPTVTGVSISNGIGWSPDGRTMYYIDTPTGGVDAFDFDVATGAATGRRRVIDLSTSDVGSPDRLAVDAEGFVWVATWGSAAVRRFAPDGVPDAVVTLPVTAVSSCAFGGADLGDLYVTTATYGLTPDERRAQPSAGGLFRCRPGVRGQPVPPFGTPGPAS
jgi:sugar lactone lactonase YvrE